MGGLASSIGASGPNSPKAAIRSVAGHPPVAQLRNPRKKKVSSEATRQTDAAWFADALLAAPLSEIGEMLDGADDAALLLATLDMIHRQGPGNEVEKHRVSMLHIGIINHVERLQALEAAHHEIIDLVIEIRETKGGAIVTGNCRAFFFCPARCGE